MIKNGNFVDVESYHGYVPGSHGDAGHFSAIDPVWRRVAGSKTFSTPGVKAWATKWLRVSDSRAKFRPTCSRGEATPGLGDPRKFNVCLNFIGAVLQHPVHTPLSFFR